MKKMPFIRSIITISFSISILFIGISCDKEKVDERPDLPPMESLVMDFSDFSQQPGAKKGTEINHVNFGHAFANVFVFHFATTLYIAPPIIAYAAALQQTPEYMGDNTWGQTPYRNKGQGAAVYLLKQLRDLPAGSQGALTRLAVTCRPS